MLYGNKKKQFTNDLLMTATSEQKQNKEIHVNLVQNHKNYQIIKNWMQNLQKLTKEYSLDCYVGYLPTSVLQRSLLDYPFFFVR